MVIHIFQLNWALLAEDHFIAATHAEIGDIELNFSILIIANPLHFDLPVKIDLYVILDGAIWRMLQSWKDKP